MELIGELHWPVTFTHEEWVTITSCTGDWLVIRYRDNVLWYFIASPSFDSQLTLWQSLYSEFITNEQIFVVKPDILYLTGTNTSVAFHTHNRKALKFPAVFNTLKTPECISEGTISGSFIFTYDTPPISDFGLFELILLDSVGCSTGMVFPECRCQAGRVHIMHNFPLFSWRS